MFSMQVNAFDVYLFDFDGLLVNTEQLHFLAYQNAFEERGEKLELDFNTYCMHAHTKMRNGIHQFSADFDDVKKRKKRIYLELLHQNYVQLMEGVNEFLLQLASQEKKMCVVTNSTKDTTDVIRNQIEELNLIPHWITREDVQVPKPDPEGYLLAMERFATREDRVIGFEDTPKGIEALVNTRAQPVFVASKNHFAASEVKKKGAWHFSSFSNMLQEAVS